MRLRGITPGDLVEVNDGIPYVAEVLEVEHSRLRVKPMMEGRRRQAPRPVRAAWVVGWWKRMPRRTA